MLGIGGRRHRSWDCQQWPVGSLAGQEWLAQPAHQPVVLLGMGVFALLLAVGVVLPAVWSRDLKRQEAAARVLHVLLIALCGDRFAATLKTLPESCYSRQS